jgi:hypothetical protein
MSECGICYLFLIPPTLPFLKKKPLLGYDHVNNLRHFYLQAFYSLNSMESLQTGISSPDFHFKPPFLFQGSRRVDDFIPYHRAIAIKTTWYWHKNRYEDQWNRIEDLDMNPHSYAHLIFDKVTKNI